MKTIKQFTIVILHACILFCIIFLAGRMVTSMNLKIWIEAMIILLILCFLLVSYVILIVAYEDVKKMNRNAKFTLRFYKGNKYSFLIVRQWFKYKSLVLRMFFIHCKLYLRNERYFAGRDTDKTPAFCNNCLWIGKTESAVHTYRFTGDEEVEPVDLCPKCFNEV
jgi:hypothetical protein